MEALLPNNLILLALCSIATLMLGYVIGSRVSRKHKRGLQRELNQQSLDMLDVKSKHTKLTKFLGQSNRKDKLLKLTLKQLTEANQRANILQERVNRIEKQHYIKISRLRLLSTQATEKARRSSLIATHATKQLKQLRTTHSASHTLSATAVQTYGQAAAAPVNVVDRQSSDTQRDAITRVSNRDSARFTRLKSSNEGQRFDSANLQAIEGIDRSVEKKLNQVGIHRIEQLANMSESDLAALSVAVGNLKEGRANKYYTAAWKGGAQRLLGQS